MASPAIDSKSVRLLVAAGADAHQMSAEIVACSGLTDTLLSSAIAKGLIGSVVNLQMPSEAAYHDFKPICTAKKLPLLDAPISTATVTAADMDIILKKIAALPKPAILNCTSSVRSSAVGFLYDLLIAKIPVADMPKPVPAFKNVPPPGLWFWQVNPATSRLISRMLALHSAGLPQDDETTAPAASVRPVVTCIPHYPTATCTYVVACPRTARAVIIDPVMDFKPNSGACAYTHADSVLKFVAESKLTVQYVLETHAHADHLTGAQRIAARALELGLSTDKARAPAIAIGSNIRTVQKTFSQLLNLQDCKADGSDFDVLLADGQELKFGELTLHARNTPGHTPACMTYQIADAVFTGDTIFMPDIGTARCDFPGGSASALWDSIQHLWKLPGSTRIFVGHDYPPAPASAAVVGRPFRWETTVAEQKKYNKMVKDGISREQFIELRTARDATLDVPNLLYPSIEVNIRGGRLPPAEANGRSFLRIPVALPSAEADKKPAAAGAACATGKGGCG